jgi:nucleoside-diphosphate-sugar epimerase
MRVLIIGGTGFIGPRVVARLCDLGHEVAVFHRGRTEAELSPEVQHIHCPSAVRADRSHLAGFVEEFRSFAPDVVLDMIPVTEDDARSVASIFRGLASRVVAISSQDVYRAYGILCRTEPSPPEPEPVPITEDSALRTRLYPYRGAEPREAGDERRWMDDYEKILVERVTLAEPELPGTVLRLPMVYGPRDKQHRMYEHLRRMQDERPAILLDEGLARWRWTRGYVENIAAAVALAITDERAAGKTYNVGEVEALPMIDWVREIGRAAGWSGRIIPVPSERLPDHLRTPVNTEQDLVTDSTRIREDLGYEEPVPLEEALLATVEWESRNPPEQADDLQPDYAAEDALLSELS